MYIFYVFFFYILNFNYTSDAVDAVDAKAFYGVLANGSSPPAPVGGSAAELLEWAAVEWACGSPSQSVVGLQHGTGAASSEACIPVQTVTGRTVDVSEGWQR